jgi:pimeloyl-ACP methyl ester carboxylesterase
VVEMCDGPLDLVGVSMGGAVAQQVAVRHPDRVRSVLLACCGPGRAGPMTDPDGRADDVRRLGLAGTLDSTLQRWFSAGAIATPGHPGVEYVRARWLTDNTEVVVRAWLALGHHALREELRKVKGPVTVLGARHDQAVPIARLLDLFDLLPAARLEVIEGPHMLQLEQPIAFAKAVRRHLAWAGVADS